MPRFEVLDIDEAALNVRDNEIFVPAAYKFGRFRVLTPLQRIVLEQRYLGGEPLTDEEIGLALKPPKSAARMRQIRLEAIGRLEYYNVRSIDPLGLSMRTRNAILRNFGDISAEDLARKIEEEDKELLRHTRQFGKKSLQEVIEKLASYQPQPS